MNVFCVSPLCAYRLSSSVSVGSLTVWENKKQRNNRGGCKDEEVSDLLNPAKLLIETKLQESLVLWKLCNLTVAQIPLLLYTSGSFYT